VTPPPLSGARYWAVFLQLHRVGGVLEDGDADRDGHGAAGVGGPDQLVAAVVDSSVARVERAPVEHWVVLVAVVLT